METTARNGVPLLRCEHVNKHYDDGDVAAVVDLDLTIKPGEYVAIMGPSGCGKSTLLNLLGALDMPTSGEVYFEGERVRSVNEVDRLRALKIGFVFQAFHLLPTLTAIENVQIPMFESELGARKRELKARDLLESVKMGHRRKHLPAKLSAGERQRVAIARALANDPILLLADEPTGNLDSKTGDEVMAMFADLHRLRQMTLVVVTHSQEVADKSQRLLRMRDGRIVSDELLAASQPRA
jgi:putative ABC transport system ATP-binding protein